MLKSVKISKLFGTFNYSFSLKDEGISILTGPNGFGKSTILNVINSVYNENIDGMLKFPFTEIELTFTDKTSYNLRYGDVLDLAVEKERIKTAKKSLGTVRYLSNRFNYNKEEIPSVSELTARIKQIILTDSGTANDNFDLFLSQINEKLKFKKAVIEDGEIKIIPANSTKYLPLESLSSGEQQLMLFYFELIFGSDEETLLLIDEPEISLHIAWQMRLISDLKTIIDRSKKHSAVIIATHSPQVINGNWDLQIDLGEMYDGD